MAAGRCSGCGEMFNSDGAHALHRVGGFYAPHVLKAMSEQERHDTARRCLSVEEMLTRGMSKNERGRWIGETMDTEKVERVRLSE